MANYQVVLTKTVQKQLDKLPGKVADDLLDVIEELAADPRPNGCKKLKGRAGIEYAEETIVSYTTFRILF